MLTLKIETMKKNMIFLHKSLAIVMLMATGISMTSFAADYKAEEGDWTIKIDESTKKMSLTYRDINLLNDVYAASIYNYAGEAENHSVSSLSLGLMPEITETTISDCFGYGKRYDFRYSADGAVLTHSFYFYSELPYALVQVKVESADGRDIQSGSLTALAVGAPSTPLTGASNRMVWVPFDNDGHLKYEVNLMKGGEEMTSHEVGYVFDGESRRGLIAGSVDHDTWKSGVSIAGTNGYRIERFECLSGYTGYFTRDVLPHGKVTGKSVASARFFLGLYDDWREGLNDFGEANTKVMPRAEWSGGNPMGWSSWGVQQNYITYDGVEESARFIKDNLYDLGFHDADGRTVISLDAFASDNIPSNKLWSLGTKVFSDGTYRDGRDTKQGTNQILGEYCGPLVAWEWALDSKVPGTGLNGTPDYTYRDIALKVNGQPYVLPSNKGCAVDPTHPGVKANIEFFLKQFATNGTKYIKVDFLNNGIIEGDSWYDPNITTGVQAYNYGMKLLYEEASKYGMYIVESISPIFPYQYAHGRRTCCDRFSEIGETEYVMNAMTYGWWTDRLYTVNDPDQLVMCKGGHGANETLGENRARATSGMATGAFIFGDNFSDNVLYTDTKEGHKQGETVGYPEESRLRAIEIMGNSDINEYVRNNIGSFMPVDGHKPSSSQSAESMFVRRTDDALYLAVFNYGRLFSSNGSVEYERLGLSPDEEISEIKELWSGEVVVSDGRTLDYSVPAKDVKVFRFLLGDTGGIDQTMALGESITLVRIAKGLYCTTGLESIREYRVYDISGAQVVSGNGTSYVDLSSLAVGVYVVDMVTPSGVHCYVKIINN